MIDLFLTNNIGAPAGEVDEQINLCSKFSSKFFLNPFSSNSDKEYIRPKGGLVLGNREIL